MIFFIFGNNYLPNPNDYFPNVPFNSSNSILSQNARDIILKIINQGTNMMNCNTTDQQFELWTSYAKDMLDIAIKNDQLQVKTQFLEIVFSAQNANLQPFQKIHFCIQFLLNVLKTV